MKLRTFFWKCKHFLTKRNVIMRTFFKITNKLFQMRTFFEIPWTNFEIANTFCKHDLFIFVCERIWKVKFLNSKFVNKNSQANIFLKLPEHLLNLRTKFETMNIFLIRKQILKVEHIFKFLNLWIKIKCEHIWNLKF